MKIMEIVIQKRLKVSDNIYFYEKFIKQIIKNPDDFEEYLKVLEPNEADSFRNEFALILNTDEIVKYYKEEKHIHDAVSYREKAFSNSCDFNSIDVAKLLLKKGVNPNIFDRNCLPVTHALISKNFELAELLIKYGAKLNIRNANGYLPIHHVIGITNDTSILKKLLKSDCSTINERTENSIPVLREVGEKTPLALALQSSKIEYVNLLLKYGADVSVLDSKSKLTVFDMVLRQVAFSRDSFLLNIETYNSIFVKLLSLHAKISDIHWVFEYQELIPPLATRAITSYFGTLMGRDQLLEFIGQADKENNLLLLSRIDLFCKKMR